MSEKRENKQKIRALLKELGIKKVIFNDKTTILFLTTGEKGIATCGVHDEFDPAVGLAMAYTMAESNRSKKDFKSTVESMYGMGGFEIKAPQEQKVCGSFGRDGVDWTSLMTFDITSFNAKPLFKNSCSEIHVGKSDYSVTLQGSFGKK